MLPIDAFIESLAEFQMDRLFNPWREVSPVDYNSQMPFIRQHLLKQHLSCATPRLLIIGDALDYYGARQTGVPMTSEYLALNHRVPRLRCSHRLTNTPNMFHAPSDGVYWQLLHRHSLADRTLCWYVLPFQPVNPNTGLNRMPQPDELEAGMVWLQEMLYAFPETPILAIGTRVRQQLKRFSTRHPIYYSRHPSRGGVPDTTKAIEAVAATDIA